MIFKVIFKPFNIVYKKKNINRQWFMEILTEDINLYFKLIRLEKTKRKYTKIKKLVFKQKTKKIEEENKTNDDDTISKFNNIRDTSSNINKRRCTSSNNIKDTCERLIIQKMKKNK